MSDWYALDVDRNPVQIDFDEYLAGDHHMSHDERRVAHTRLFPRWNFTRGRGLDIGWHHTVSVSTVFLQLDHGWGEGPPVVFETMIFGGLQNDYQERYCTWAEAEAGHTVAVRRARLSWLYWLLEWSER